MNQVPNQGILSGGIPVQTVPQRRAPLFVTPPASKVADTFGAVGEEKLAKAMSASVKKEDSRTIGQKIVEYLHRREGTVEDIIRAPGRGHDPASVRRAINALARTGDIQSSAINGIHIYRADHSARPVTPAQRAKARRAMEFVKMLQIMASFPAPETAAEITKHCTVGPDAVRERLRSMRLDGLIQVIKHASTPSPRYTVTPAGLAFMKGKAE